MYVSGLQTVLKIKIRDILCISNNSCILYPCIIVRCPCVRNVMPMRCYSLTKTKEMYVRATNNVRPFFIKKQIMFVRWSSNHQDSCFSSVHSLARPLTVKLTAVILYFRAPHRGARLQPIKRQPWLATLHIWPRTVIMRSILLDIRAWGARTPQPAWSSDTTTRNPDIYSYLNACSSLKFE